MSNSRIKSAEVYRSGLVVRYHNNPELSWFRQNNGAHTWGVVTLLLLLHPNPTVALLAAAQMHDVGEYVACDLSGPFKRKNPALAKAHAELERLARIEMTDGRFEIASESDAMWINFCDKLEALLHTKVHRPDVAETRGWPEQEVYLLNFAARLGIEADVIRLLREISHP